MSSKRSATTDLNHDNWDQEFEKEEKGVMKVATEKDLQARKIIHARRKLPPREGATNSPFAGLNLFGSKASTPTFSFGMTSPSNVSGLFSNLSNNTSSPIINKPSEEKLKDDENSNDEPTAKRSRPNTSDDNQIVMEKTLTPIKEVCASEEEKEEQEQEEKVPSTPESVQAPSSISQSVSPSNLSATPTLKTDETNVEENGESIKTSIDLPSNENNSDNVPDDDNSIPMPPDSDDW